MITRQQFIANAMVKEFALNGASLLWHTLNEAFCNPASWYCQSERMDIEWFCLEPVDDGKTHCDDCMDAIQAEAVEQYDTEGRYELLHRHADYQRATWPRGF